MGRHLPIEHWFDTLTSPAGRKYLRMKRVDAAADATFPRELRQVWGQHGPAALVKAIMTADGLALAAAWDKAKAMANCRRIGREL